MKEYEVNKNFGSYYLTTQYKGCSWLGWNLTYNQLLVVGFMVFILLLFSIK